MNLPAQTKINTVSINKDMFNAPYFIDECDTIVKLFAKRCAQLGDTIAHREKHLGIWHSYSWNDYFTHARKIGLAFMELGLKRGDVVSILSEDNKEWLYLDMGIQSVGGIVSGVYTTDSASQLAYLINDSGSKFLVVENDEMLDKYLEIKDQVPTIEKIIILDKDGLHDFKRDAILFLDEIYDIGAVYHKNNPQVFSNEIAKSQPSDLGLLIYTSGTTGKPKGAMLSHENVIFTIASSLKALPYFKNDEQLCFLPLCHILERTSSVYSPIVSQTIVNFVESSETIFDNLQEVAPHVFVAVPRVWEKIYSRIALMAQDSTYLGKWAYKTAIKAGRKRAKFLIKNHNVPLFTELCYQFWNFLVFNNLRRMLGFGNIRRAISGAAPISSEVLEYFRAIGVNLVEGYGQTEGSGLTSVNMVHENRDGSVGKAIMGTNIRIADDGEIQLKGAHIFPGYWQNPEKTAETMTEDGYLKTGDVGHLDKDGFLTITGRLKDIIITAGGKNITPSEFENRLKASVYISDAVIIGDKRKYLTCLVMIDQENVEKFAQDEKIPFNDFSSLCAAKQVQQLIGTIIDTINKDFARVEQVKNFSLINIILTAEDDELTATMKLKRSFVEKKYHAMIDKMYK